MRSNKRTELSVCITTFNMEKYIECCIESVLAQKTDFEYEIIVADDCSTDNTIAILQRYQQRMGEKFRILYAERNRGLIENYVGSLKAANGKYIASLDADDYWVDEYKLQKQVNALGENKDVGYIHTNFFYTDDTYKKKWLARSPHYRPSHNAFISNLLDYDIALCSSCIRKSVLDFKELDMFVDKKFCAQDLPLFLSLALKTKGHYMSEATTVCMARTNSMSRQTSIPHNIKVKNKTFEIRAYFMDKYPVPAGVKAKIKFRYRLSVLLAAWASKDFDFIQPYVQALHLRDFLKHNPKASYIYIASRNKFLYRLFIPWVLRKRSFDK